jgi:hypothetical protein
VAAGLKGMNKKGYGYAGEDSYFYCSNRCVGGSGQFVPWLFGLLYLPLQFKGDAEASLVSRHG